MSDRERVQGGGGEGGRRGGAHPSSDRQTEIVKFIALQFPSSSTLKIWSVHVVVV